MTEEDEEFQRLEREVKLRRMAEEDDDIQDYKKPWVGLTDEEFHDLQIQNIDDPWANFKAIEAKLKEKNT